MFEEFKEKLKLQFANPLPGEMAHNMMMPTVRDDNLKMPDNQIAPVQSAVLILFYPDEQRHVNFPLIQRPNYNGAHSAQVSFPGGKKELADKNLIHTALRETHEEIGVPPGNVEVLGELTELFIWVSNYIVTPVVAWINEKPEFIREEKEVDKIIETNLYDIINPEKRKEGTIIARGKYKIQTPYFDIDNRIVWGATAMMLSELSMVVERAEIFKH